MLSPLGFTPKWRHWPRPHFLLEALGMNLLFSLFKFMTESGSLQLSDWTSLFLGGRGPWDEERVFWRSGYHPEAVNIPCLVTHFPPFLMPATEGWVLLKVRIPLNPPLPCLCWLQAEKISSLPKPCDWIEFTYNLESFPYFTTDRLNSTCRTLHSRTW